MKQQGRLRQKTDFFTNKLLERGYKEDEISKTITEIDHSKRQENINNKQTNKETTNNLIFTTTYSPYIKTKDLKECLLKYWAELEKDETLKFLFPKPPIIAYKRNKNIKDALVKTKFTGITNKDTQVSEQTTDSIRDPNIDILASLLEEQ